MNKKKILSLIMALVMIVGVFSPLTAFADTNKTPREGTASTSTFTADDISTTYPTDGKTTLIIHKLQSSSFTVAKPGQTHDGGKLSNEAIEALGKTPKGLNGVEFKYYKIEDKDIEKFRTMVDDPDSYKTPAQVEAYLTGVTGTTATTATVDGEKGIIKLENLEPGNYWFVETGNYTKDATDPDAPDNISSYIAVPFGITLPLTNTTKITVGNETYEPGTVWLKNVHTYPKNVTGNESVPDKTVGNLVNKHETHDVGDTVTWYMNATIPTNIKDYKKFGFSDTLEEMLDYVGNIEVKYGSGDKKEFADLEKTLTADTHYTVVAYNQATRTFEVKLTEAGIAEIAANIEGITNPKISVKFDTTLNDKAKVSTGNPNEYTLKFNNGNGEDKEKKSDKPKVYTGERKFVKTDQETRALLKDATFIVKNNKKDAPNQYLKIDETTKAVSWVAEADATPFTTDANGEITVGKLEYTYAIKEVKEIGGVETVTVDKTKQLNDYQLIETQAPDGYGKLDAPIPFEIDQESGTKGAVKIDQGKAIDDAANGTHTEIKNKKLTIPQTGGIGTVIFTVVGVGLMAGAVMAMKKNREEA